MKLRVALPLLLLVAAAPLRAQTSLSPLPEKRHIRFLALEQARRLGGGAGEELLAFADRWNSLTAKDRDWLEELLFVLGELTASQREKLFAPAARKTGDEKRQAILRVFNDLVGRTSIPAPDKENPAVCVVILHAGVSHKIGFGDRDWEHMPRIAHEIMPYGTFLSSLSSPWTGNLDQRPQWIGSFLSGFTMGGIIPDGDVWKFMKPTVFHYFRKNALCPEGKAWMISSNDSRTKIIYDHLPAANQVQWSERYRPISLTSIHLRRYDDAVRDHFLSEIREQKHPLRVQADLPATLTPGKLRITTDFSDPEACDLITRVIASRGGNLCDNNAFVQEMAVQLFRSDLNPELVVVRFGPDWSVRELKKPRERAERMARKARDDDEAAYNLWVAFRQNPYLRRNGYFLVVAEGHPGAVVVGPDVPKGQVVGTRFKIAQMITTIAHMLHFDWKKFGEPFLQRPPEPILALFQKD